MKLRLNRRVGVAVLMSIMLVLAGCSGGVNTDDDTATETTETEDSEIEETTADSTSEETTNETTVSNRTTDQSPDRDTAANGRMLLVIDGRDTHPDNGSSANASFWLDGEHAWYTANESLTLEEALAQLEIDANAGSLTYDGTTYRDANDTTVSYKVNGESVDPTAYELESEDDVFVTVHTSNTSTPGRYFQQSHPHPHGSLNVTVNGTSVDFTESKYTHVDEYFHFHGDEGAERWHAHSTNVTIEYAMSTFPGFDVTNDSVTYKNTTYQRSDDVEIDITVNGESVDPSTYILKDGDDVNIVVEETDAD